ncbi:MAG: hypothetical protein INQ03_07830 [Candidatus Heimdallarchaeota archaeon]|nr:hypothetical protein [Candidatus Heimdallarchaeota archaeon]
MRRRTLIIGMAILVIGSILTQQGTSMLVPDSNLQWNVEDVEYKDNQISKTSYPGLDKVQNPITGDFFSTAITWSCMDPPECTMMEPTTELKKFSLVGSQTGSTYMFTGELDLPGSNVFTNFSPDGQYMIIAKWEGGYSFTVFVVNAVTMVLNYYYVSTIFAGENTDTPTWQSVAIDNNQNYYIAGYATVTGMYNPTKVTVNKFNGNTQLWATSTADLMDPLERAEFLHVDMAGNIYVSGYYEHPTSGGRKVYLTKLDPSGNIVYAQRFGHEIFEPPLYNEEVTFMTVQNTSVYIGYSIKYSTGWDIETVTEARLQLLKLDLSANVLANISLLDMPRENAEIYDIREFIGTELIDVLVKFTPNNDIGNNMFRIQTSGEHLLTLPREQTEYSKIYHLNQTAVQLSSPIENAIYNIYSYPSEVAVVDLILYYENVYDYEMNISWIVNGSNYDIQHYELESSVYSDFSILDRQVTIYNQYYVGQYTSDDQYIRIRSVNSAGMTSGFYTIKVQLIQTTQPSTIYPSTSTTQSNSQPTSYYTSSDTTTTYDTTQTTIYETSTSYTTSQDTSDEPTFYVTTQIAWITVTETLDGQTVTYVTTAPGEVITVTVTNEVTIEVNNTISGPNAPELPGISFPLAAFTLGCVMIVRRKMQS